MKSGVGDIERTEAFLVGCAQAIRHRGLKLVFNAGEVFDAQGNCVGCCVTHAQEHVPKRELKKLGEMVLPEDDGLFDRAWDAIEAGFDGLGQENGIELHVADREYRGLITDVLIDVSAGKGVPIDPAKVRGIVEAMRTWNANLGIGIAGGLCAETLPAVADLVREYDLSIDAEGRLRNDRDELDLEKVRAYLGAAARIRGWA